ncbi:hypothetical protein ES711_08290 [Gelidibacter salicanalis]|uniref:PorT family protein n=1 Tax=Gelidibacter salicanalis TaxID=291193 RepID=A0A5C7APM3_9FLAO|nr:hypothetical protein [Gelidibacter salicanalis]TXE08495.1 hypothetical protein ES711_08290 [Gelidibacter salicanalis]
MNDKKHIDRLFQEKFKNFEATPDDAVWENIHNALHKDERKRRVIPLWWKLAGVAALLALLFTVGSIIFETKNGEFTPENQMVGTEKVQDTSASSVTESYENATKIVTSAEDSEPSNGNPTLNQTAPTINPHTNAATQIVGNTPTKENTNAPLILNNAASKANSISAKTENKAVVKNTPNLPQPKSKDDIYKRDHKTNDAIANAKSEALKMAQTPIQNPEEKQTLELPSDPEESITLSKNDDSIEEAIAEANAIRKEDPDTQPNRWNITPTVAPVYFNTLGKGSSIDGQFVNNSKSGEVNMSYGINGSYAISDKIKVRAGINKVNLGYSTNGVMAYNQLNSFGSAAKTNQLQNINFRNHGSSNSFLSTSNLSNNSAPQALVSNTEGALEQQFGYIEIPLEMEYTIIDRKFGFNIIGGFSTLFLNNNEVFSVLENQRALIGEANNINSTSYSANFGLGFNYNLSRMLRLNLEPMFKYQINTFTNTSGDFRPYYIGVYTGFSFKF